MKQAPFDEAHFRDLLVGLRAALLAVAKTGDEAAATVELDQTRLGRLSRMDALQAQAMSIETRRRRTLRLQQITAALGRLDNGDYGFCVRCDEPIDPRRLEVDPAALKCFECADRETP